MTPTSYPGTVRQLIVTGLGRDAPTVIITNDTQITATATARDSVIAMVLAIQPRRTGRSASTRSPRCRGTG
ncbi:MAG: hypothetical protein M3Z75_31880 [Actinomycetota bacterium]|nr:hypothetical protein [Actinomycetota bacterium]